MLRELWGNKHFRLNKGTIFAPKKTISEAAAGPLSPNQASHFAAMLYLCRQKEYVPYQYTRTRCKDPLPPKAPQRDETEGGYYGKCISSRRRND